MKYFISIIILGIIEITTTGYLHDLIGAAKLVGLYIITTIIGAFFLYIKLPEAKKALISVKKIKKKLKKSMKKTGYKPTHVDLLKLKPSYYLSIYIPAVILIAIPGVITDILGIIMAFPFVSNWLIERSMNKQRHNETSA